MNVVLDNSNTVIWALEMMLARAREGKASYFIGVMAVEGERSVGGWFGDPSMEKTAMDHLSQMSDAMVKMVDNKTLPARTALTGADRVCCNVADDLAPISFDFVDWLIDKEMTRRKVGAPFPLKVGFWFGQDEQVILNPYRQKMFDNVVKPMLALIGAVEDPTAIVDGEWKQGFGFKRIVDGARAGAEVPKFFAPKNLVYEVMNRYRKRRPVTITLRECEQWPHRNSNLKAWKKFARYLQERGEHVVLVRDTAKANETYYGFETCPEASIDLHYRAALYQVARMNLFVSNGPGSLAYFSDWSWMNFIKIEDDGHRYAPNTPKFWHDNFGMEIGDQLPWSRRDQRIIWSGDDYENIVAAWEEMQSSYSIAAE